MPTYRQNALPRLARGRVWRALRLFGACALLAAAAAHPAAARIFQVVPSSTGSGAGASGETEGGGEDGTDRRPYRSLARAVAAASAWAAAHPDEGATIRLLPGTHVLEPQPLVEETCGNCEDPQTAVPVTTGIVLSGRGLRLQGEGDVSGPDLSRRSVIETNAGYGVLLRDCQDCWVQDVVITGGERDTSGQATDAAIVAQRSTATIEGCEIRDNIGDPQIVGRTIAGICGICGREGSRLHIRRNRIIRNSWDGIALYRDSEADITDNVIDGVDLAVGGAVGGGRGVGIGVTWNGKAVIRGNLVRRYWKGIGLFVDADGRVEENVVEQVATWGLSLWDAGQGRPRGVFRGNAVDSTGACGALILRLAPGDAGELTGNAFCRTGQNPKYDSGEPYCRQTAIARHEAPEGFRISQNLLFGNREPQGGPGPRDSDRREFDANIGPFCLRLSAWNAARESAFYRRHALAGRPR
jgi:hypothetical protein